VGLPEGGEAPLPNFPVVVPGHVDVAGIYLVVDHLSLEVLHGMAELPQDPPQLLASIGS